MNRYWGRQPKAANIPAVSCRQNPGLQRSPCRRRRLIRRILIVRLSSIGDVMHTLPTLCALRNALPKAFIGWVVEGGSAQLLTHHKAIDEVIRVPRKWLKSPRTVLALRSKLRSLRFDVAIDIQGLTKSAVAARLSGARRRIGIDGPDGRELSRWLNNELVRPTTTHIIDRNLELLKPLGIERPAVRFGLDVLPAEAASADKMLADVELSNRFVMLNPGAGWPSKLWPPARFAAVARYLGEYHALRSLVVWAGQQEHQWAEEIVSASAGFATLAPPTTLRELAALAHRAMLSISADTGPLHIAVAVGTPCIGLFGPMPAERNGPYGPQHVSVQRILLKGTSRDAPHRRARVDGSHPRGRRLPSLRPDARPPAAGTPHGVVNDGYFPCCLYK